MFPSATPGEWEPTKIKTKVITKTKITEAIPTIEPAEPVPIEVDAKPVLPVEDGEPPKVESNEQQTNGDPQKVEVMQEQTKAEVPKPEQPNGDAPNVEIPEVAQSKVDQPPREEPKVDQLDGAIPLVEDVEMKEASTTEEAPKPEIQDTEMTQPPPEPTLPEPAVEEPSTTTIVEDETVETFEDDHWTTEGAVYPIVEGRIENWSCFFALLSHIYNMISPPFHMPVLFVAQPCWSARDHEMITQYVFENWKIPAFCLMDSALTACYAYGVSSALVVDVGHGKCDVSAVTEFQVSDIGRGTAIAGCGGLGMTQRLQQVLEKQGFDEGMAEQLKKSPACEILPLGTAYPQAAPNGVAPPVINPAAAASTGAVDSGAGAKDVEGQRPGQAPRGPGFGTTVGEEGANGEDDDNEGVFDVAAIVARDNAAELLAKREREKAEKAAAKKGAAAEPRLVRLRNSEREKGSFTYVDYVPLEEEANSEQPMSRKRKREIEVGVERFMAVTPPPGLCDGIIDTIAEAIHHAVLSVPDIPQRANIWDNLIVVGNGSRIRGMALCFFGTLHANCSQASHLPSCLSLPRGTSCPLPPPQSSHPSSLQTSPLLSPHLERTHPFPAREATLSIIQPATV